MALRLPEIVFPVDIEVKVTVELAALKVPDALSQLEDMLMVWVVDALNVPLLSRSAKVVVAAADVE